MTTRHGGMKRILALTRYDQVTASTRQRFLQYGPALARAGFELRIDSLLAAGDLGASAPKRRATPLELTKSYIDRMATLLGRSNANLLWVQYESFPFLPGFFERAAFRAGVPVVIDYDDAFFHRYDRHRSGVVRRILGAKMRPLIRGAAEIVAGNAYLADYARQWNRRVTIVPTVVDTELYRPCAKNRQALTIGWMGSPTTWHAYVRPYLGLLRQVCEETNTRFLAVGAGMVPGAEVFPGMELRSWDVAREVADIQAMDIGIMPLPDDPWARGKCGYKLIQYMACGLPTVASKVGVNADIVQPGKTGFLVDTREAWLDALTQLIKDQRLRASMGSAGRARVEGQYSLASQAPALIEVMRRAVAR
jgi:glycosyltransferase involved in cell wall biosynthesis